MQAQAITQAAFSKVMVLTGGPGTGKTTTLNGIIAEYKSHGMRILLAAPTGRAGKRMSEATGMEAKTIHRLLEYNPMDGYKRNPENPLEGDALIVDECSMIDTVLMNSLLKAIPQNMRLILVGDVDQLPSVGAGNVLRDIIDSGTVPVIRLTRIFRKALQGHASLQGLTVFGLFQQSGSLYARHHLIITFLSLMMYTPVFRSFTSFTLERTRIPSSVNTSNGSPSATTEEMSLVAVTLTGSDS